MTHEDLQVEREPNEKIGLLRKLGDLTGLAPIDDGSGRSISEQRMIRTMHDKGGAGFRILRSAETSMRSFDYPAGQRPMPAKRSQRPEHP